MRRILAAVMLALAPAAALSPAVLPAPAAAEDAEVLELKATKAFETLFAQVPGARELAREAEGVLMMPEITKAGLIVGGAYGEGVLRVNGTTVDYYSVAAASIGLQAGAQRSSQAIFFMTTGALERFRRADGWTISADAEVTLPPEGRAANLSSQTAQQPVVAVTFGQSGILAGVSMAGAKYSRIVR
jgi:lipid-binding SYLF domain-containing protein